MSGRQFLHLFLFISLLASTLTAQTTPAEQPQSPQPTSPPLTTETPTQPTQPAITNAADLYREAFDTLTHSSQPSEPGSSSTPDLTSLITPLIDKYQLTDQLDENDLAAAELAIANAEQPLTLLRSIPPNIPVLWPVDLTSTTYKQQTPHLPLLSYASQLIYLDALVAAHHKDASRLTADLSHLISLSNTLTNDQHLTALTTRIDILNYAQSLEALLAQNLLSPDQLLQIQNDLRAADLIPQLKATILYERSQALIYTRDYIKDVILPTLPTDTTFTEEQLTEDLIQANRQTFTKFMTEFLTRLEHYQFDFSDLVKQAKQLPETEILTRQLLPHFANTVTNRFAIAQAQLNTTVVAIALHRYKLKNTQYPSTLDALVPEFLRVVPVDPFDRTPLRYIFDTENNAAVIYALGPDLLDNQGRAYTSQATPTLGRRPSTPTPSYIYTDITFNLGQYQQIHFPESLITNAPSE